MIGIYLPLFLILYLVKIIFSTVNVTILLKSWGNKIGFFQILKENWISRSVSVFLPGRFGELSLSYLLQKYDIPYSQGLIVFLVDKIISLVIVGILGIIGIIIFFDSYMAFESGVILVILIAGILLSLLSSRIRYFVRKYMLRKYARIFQDSQRNSSSCCAKSILR